MPDSDPPPGKPHDKDVAIFNEGMALLQANRLEEAIEKFRHAASTGMDRPMEHYALAAALYRKGELAEAREEFQIFLDASPKPNRYVQQARAILPIIEKKLARNAPEKPKPDPLSQSAAYETAINAYLRGDYAEAEECFLEALDSFPENKHVYNNLGLTSLALNQDEKAIEHFQKALRIDPNFVEAHNNLGLAWNAYGTLKAREAFEAALAIDPNFFDALVNLGSLYYRQGDLPRSREMWRRAAEIRPDDAQVRRNLALFR